MNETLSNIVAFTAGLILGAMFFGGLWFTVNICLKAKLPWLWVMGSFIIRVSITLTGFYFISAGSWHRLVS
ncbi:MAG: ATP synthase subunit I, partial [Chitinophagaceae bacterium]